MDKWKLEYRQETESWLDKLTKDQLKSVAKELKLLELCGNELRLPHSKSLGNGLFELRERNYGYRIYYTFANNSKIVLLNAGNKSSQQRDIKNSRSRLASLKNKTRGGYCEDKKL